MSIFFLHLIHLNDRTDRRGVVGHWFWLSGADPPSDTCACLVVSGCCDDDELTACFGEIQLIDTFPYRIRYSRKKLVFG